MKDGPKTVVRLNLALPDLVDGGIHPLSQPIRNGDGHLGQHSTLGLLKCGVSRRAEPGFANRRACRTQHPGQHTCEPLPCRNLASEIAAHQPCLFATNVALLNTAPIRRHSTGVK